MRKSGQFNVCSRFSVSHISASLHQQVDSGQLTLGDKAKGGEEEERKKNNSGTETIDLHIFCLMFF